MPYRKVQFRGQEEQPELGYPVRHGGYSRYECEDGKPTKSTHGYYYGCHDRYESDGYWTWGLFCFLMFFFILILLPLLAGAPFDRRYRYSRCGCNGGYGYLTYDGDGCGCNSHDASVPYLSSQLFSGDEALLRLRGAIPDKDGNCSPGEELWFPPNTKEQPRCVLELGGGNGSHAAMVDQSVNACKNFYQHASGKWLEGAPRDVGRFFGDAAATAAQIQQTIDTVDMARTWDHDRLGAMMGSCLSAYAAPNFDSEKGAIEYVERAVQEFRKADGTFSLTKAIGALTKRGLISPLYLDVQRAPDKDDSWIVLVDAGQTFTHDYEKETRYEIVEEVLREKGVGEKVVAIEDQIQEVLGKAEVDSDDEELFFNYMLSSSGFTSHVFWGGELDRAFKGFSWSELYETVGQKDLKKVRHWVRSPDVLRGLVDLEKKLVKEGKSELLVKYFKFSVLVQMFEFLPATYGFLPVESELEQISLDVHHIGLNRHHLLPWSMLRRPVWHRTSFAPNTVQKDAPSILAQRIEPRDMPQLLFAERCVRQQKIFMSDERNEAFFKVALSNKDTSRVKSVVQEIVAARKGMIRNAKEISDQGKAAILEKLDGIRIRVGNAPHQTKGAVSPDAAYWRNVANIREMDAALTFSKFMQNAAEVRGKAPFLMPTSAINAYYDPSDNTISVLAGIALYPFFSPVYDDTTVFATLGTIVGHEIGHATDAFGIRFDKSGAFTKWLPEEDMRVFEDSNACFVRQYSDITPETHQYASGSQTVTEAAADNVGIRASLEALKSLKGVEKLEEADVAEFGLQFAQMWAVHQSKESENNQVSYDPHPVALFRVNKAFENTKELLDLYGCRTEPVCRLAA